MDKIADCFDKAAELIKEKGWGRGRNFWSTRLGKRHNFCIVGAIQEVGGDLKSFADAVVSFVGYNDAPGEDKRAGCSVLARKRPRAAKWKGILA